MRHDNINNIESMRSTKFHCELPGSQEKKRKHYVILSIMISDSLQILKKGKNFPNGKFP